VRGRGAWLDDGRLVFHFGNTLMVDDQKIDVTSIKSDYIYELRRKLPFADDVAMSNDDGKRIFDVAKRFRWVNQASAYLLTGWVALAPVCGALRWRPHCWLTGEAGSGKTHIQNDFANWALSGICLYAQGNSTEAGIRQRLQHDAIPVLYDEAESNNDKDSNRIQGALSLARQASTESEALTLKGTIDGEGRDYLIRSMFLIASIQVGIKQQADHERIAKLVLLSKKDPGNSSAIWRQTKAALLTLKKDKTLPATLIR
jgi:putative DNA primase/helicase